MARQLKTFITNLGFFELAVAAPSMKAALEAWGMGHNAFQRGFARQTDDPRIIAATTAQPGIVLRRPVGSKGEFKEDAELPGDLALSAPPPPKAAVNPKSERKSSRHPKPQERVANRAAIISFEKARAKRERERAKQEQVKQREHEKRRRAIDKVAAEIDGARQEHEAAMAEIAAQRDKLDRRARLEEERWQARREKLQAARDRAEER